MKIEKLEAIPVRTPMVREFGDAYNTYSQGQFVLVKITTDEGLVGYGESPCTVTVGFYGETLETACLSIEKYLGPPLLGEDPLNIRRATSVMDIAQGNAFLPKTGIDVALYDLVGKAKNIPVSTVLGGKQRDKIKVASEIGIVSPKEMVTESMRLLDLGFRVIKLKAGKNADAEMAGLEMIRDHVGSKIEPRVDPNGGWTRSDTMRSVAKMRKCEVSILNSRCPAGTSKDSR